MAKGLKLKVTKFCGLISTFVEVIGEIPTFVEVIGEIPTFVEVIGEKLVGGGGFFGHPPS